MEPLELTEMHVASAITVAKQLRVGESKGCSSGNCTKVRVDRECKKKLK